MATIIYPGLWEINTIENPEKAVSNFLVLLNQFCSILCPQFQKLLKSHCHPLSILIKL